MDNKHGRLHLHRCGLLLVYSVGFAEPLKHASNSFTPFFVSLCAILIIYFIHLFIHN